MDTVILVNNVEKYTAGSMSLRGALWTKMLSVSEMTR